VESSEAKEVDVHPPRVASYIQKLSGINQNISLKIFNKSKKNVWL